MSALSGLLKDVPRTGAKATRQISICVLPFANMSKDEDQEYFADGISEDIITDLSKVSALAVVARNTAFTFKGKSVDVKQVARQIEVSHVLEGSVRKSGNKVRITAQLIDGATGNHLWAERYDRNLDDIFALQDEISEAIVSALRLNLLPEEKKAIESRGTNNAEAYDIFLRGRAFASQFTAESFKRAAELFQRAVDLDPNWPNPLGNLIGTLIDYAAIDPEHGKEVIERAETARQKLLALLPPGDPMREYGLTQQLMSTPPHDYLAAERAAEAALQKPGVSTWVGGMFNENVCRFNESIAYTLELRRQDPLSLALSFVLQARLDMAGRTSEAWAEYERSKDLQGNTGVIELLAFFRMQGRTPAEIQAQYERFLATRGPDLDAPVFAALEPLLFDATAAAPLIAKALEDPAFQNWVRLSWLSYFAGWFGLKDIALAAMRRGQIDLKGPTHRYLWHPILADARKEPAFKQLMRDLGLYDYWRKSGKWGDFARPVGDSDFEIVR
jgi:TolB-like protein